MKGRITSVDVARRAGVSISAVSRTFTPGASVGAQMREKVMRAAQDLGYRPNALARSLITSRSHIIGVVMSDLDNQYHPQFLELLTHELQGRGYQVLLFRGSREGDADSVIGTILQYQVDGLVLASVTLSSALAEECVAAGVPVVLFNRTTHRRICSSVTSDNLAGGRQIARFLLAGGHRRFAFVAGGANSSTNRDRQRGYLETLQEAGAKNVVCVVGNYSFEGARVAARNLFERTPRPDAIFVANDHMGFAVMDVARHEKGLRVPEDVSIVGYNDSRASSWDSYALTTVEQPVGMLVDATVDVLMEQIDGGGAPPRRVQIKGELIVRDSARRPSSGVHVSRGREIWSDAEIAVSASRERRRKAYGVGAKP